MVNEQPEALRLAQVAPYLEGGERGQWIMSAADELRRLHDEVQQLKSDLSEEVLISNEMLEVKDELLAALKWMVENDDTNEGDEPVERLGGASWNEYNEYWIDGLNKARAAINKAERTT